MSDQPKVLNVDDEVVIHRLFTKLLEKEGYQLLFAVNGEDGLELFEREHPQVILLDYRMLGMTGDEFMTQLTDSQIEQTAIIMVSGHAVPDVDLTQRNQQKLFAYFEKPFFEMEKLKQSIHEASARST